MNFSSTPEPLAAQFRARLKSFIARRVRDEAEVEDVTQEVLLRLFERGVQADEESVTAWLFTVARRVLIDRHRARILRPGASADLESLSGDEPGRDALRELSHCLGPFLEALPSGDRDLLLRVDGAGTAQSDLAREAGVAPSTMKSRVQRARSRLRGMLTECCVIECDGRGRVRHFERQGPGAGPCSGSDCSG